MSTKLSKSRQVKIREVIAEVEGVVEKEKDNFNRRAQYFSKTVREAEKQIVEHGEDMKRTIDARVECHVAEARHGKNTS